MEASPESGLRAWIEYLRDMGMYDLYRREAPGSVLPASVLERWKAGSRGGVTAGLAGSPPPKSLVEPVAAAAVFLGSPHHPVLSQALPSQPKARSKVAGEGALAARAAPRSGPVEPSRSYFSTEGEGSQGLPPELVAPMPKPNPLESLLPLPAAPLPITERGAALERLQAEIGDCTRCPLAYAGRHTIVFGEGAAHAELMFVGEGPGADEDASGRPFVGKAGQLLTNMIGAMGLQREQVYIANIVKCRPPGNRTPEFVEATTCSQFLLQQIDIVRPKLIVALGATAATYLLGVRQSLASLRGQWYQSRGAKVAVTYHPAFLLRDPRQKAEAWKDLQRVMAELGLRRA